MTSLSKKTLAGAAASAVALTGLVISAPQAIAQEGNPAPVENTEAEKGSVKLSAESYDRSKSTDPESAWVDIRFSWSDLVNNAQGSTGDEATGVTFAIIPSHLDDKGLEAENHPSITVEDPGPLGTKRFTNNSASGPRLKPDHVPGASDLDIVAWTAPGPSTAETLLGRAPVQLTEDDRARLRLTESQRQTPPPEEEPVEEAPEEQPVEEAPEQQPVEEAPEQQPVEEAPKAEQPSEAPAPTTAQQVSNGQPAPVQTAGKSQPTLANTGASVAGVAAIGGVALIAGLGVLALRRRNA
ncbi:LPXTG cell wall anchor domain-containing protein [Corynebacterium otitidis]|uniref:LPXTG cell wall anchor domain-containing protein n=1 Tax=Corynebacterium otitidis TaxID=29321 RepID=UPI00069BD415|nr:LPXTG cell wall anchor domain-containing protein [Corynebacterium otitidis]